MFFVRIDDRYIHGQVGAVWVGHLKVGNIAVFSDELIQDPLACTMQKLSASNFKVIIKGVDDGAKFLLSLSEKALDKTMVLVSNPKDIIRLMDAGVKITHVNIGHSKPSGEKKEIVKYFNVGKDDLEQYRELQNRGVKVEFQLIPAHTPLEVNFNEIEI